MKDKINIRYINHNICSIVGTRTITTSLDNYIQDTLEHLKEIHEECDRQDFNADIILIPTVQICDSSMEILHHKIDLLKSSLDRYLFADDDFYNHELKHDKILKIKRVQPTKRFKSKISHQFSQQPPVNFDFSQFQQEDDPYDDGTTPY